MGLILIPTPHLRIVEWGIDRVQNVNRRFALIIDPGGVQWDHGGFEDQIDKGEYQVGCANR